MILRGFRTRHLGLGASRIVVGVHDWIMIKIRPRVHVYRACTVEPQRSTFFLSKSLEDPSLSVAAAPPFRPKRLGWTSSDRDITAGFDHFSFPRSSGSPSTAPLPRNPFVFVLWKWWVLYWNLLSLYLLGWIKINRPVNFFLLPADELAFLAHRRGSHCQYWVIPWDRLKTASYFHYYP